MKEKKINIFDTTLRDGEQAPGFSMNVEEKLKMARQLERLQVDAIEAGFPIASEGDFEAVKKISAEIRSTTIAACERAGFHPTFAVEGAEMDGVLRMAAAGVGVAVVPSMVVERGGPLVAVRIVQPTLSRSVGVAFRRDRHHSRAADAFVARLRAFV